LGFRPAARRAIDQHVEDFIRGKNRGRKWRSLAAAIKGLIIARRERGGSAIFRGEAGEYSFPPGYAVYETGRVRKTVERRRILRPLWSVGSG